MTYFYAVEFSRQNFNFNPPLEEKIVVVFATDISFEDADIEQFESNCYQALWNQYPIWVVPYDRRDSFTVVERIRHGFSTAMIGRIRQLGERINANPT